MMRVAYVSVDPGIPVFGTKGASVHVQEVIRELLARGHQVRVLTTRKGDQIPADLAELEVIEFPLTSRDPADREQEQQHASAEIAQRMSIWPSIKSLPRRLSPPLPPSMNREDLPI